MPGEYDRYNMKHLSLTANIAGEDLGRVAGRVRRPSNGPAHRPRESPSISAARSCRCDEMLTGPDIGLVMSIVVIFLLLTANFQSVRLALVVVRRSRPWSRASSSRSGSPGTTLNIQSFMGAIMAVGVAVANAILLVTFAERAPPRGRRRRPRPPCAGRRAGCGRFS